MANTFMKVEIEYNQAGLTLFNILYGQADDAPENFALVAERVAEAARNSYMSRLSGSVSIVAVKASDNEGFREGSYVPLVPIQGNNAGQALPVNCAYTISKSFNTTRRKGRMFLPGVPETAVDAGSTVDPGEQAVVTLFMENFLALCDRNENADGSPGNLTGSDIFLTGPKTAGGTYRPIDSMTCLSTVGSQSRRRDNA